MSSENEKLVPVFMPALGAVLILAEDAKGKPLSAVEVLRIRDETPCIMMKVADARKLEETRGIEIDPRNCWHDWQKLRAELGRKPSLDPGPRLDYLNDDEEEELQKTVQDAQASLDQFRSLITDSKKSGAMPMIKTRLDNGEDFSFMWLRKAREIEGGFTGELFELPPTLNNYRVGGWVEVPSDSVLDWLVNDNGVLYGGYSVRFFRNKRPEAERAEYDDFVGVTRYAPC